MSKVKVSTKELKDPDIIESFNRICGGGTSRHVIEPKYEKILGCFKSFVGVLGALTNAEKSPLSATFRDQQPRGFEEVDEYVRISNEYIQSITMVPMPEQIMTPEFLAKINADREILAEYVANSGFKYQEDELTEKYLDIKKSKLYNDMLFTSKNLKEIVMSEKKRRGAETHDLESGSLSIKFIQNCEGDTFRPFEFTCIDFKQMYYDQTLLTEPLQEFLLKSLSIIYAKCAQLVDLHLSPDVDSSEISSVISKAIEKLRKQIPRCEKAFGKLKNAVKTLDTNINEYYKDYVTSQNPGIMLESFVSDVARKESADSEVSMQFSQILKFFKNKMKNANTSDPKIKKILGVLEKKNDDLNKIYNGAKPEMDDGNDGNNGNDTESVDETSPEVCPPENIEEENERKMEFLPPHLLKIAKDRKNRNKK